jgi:hypothetical protein
MDKIDLGTQGFVYPMPMTLVGADLAAGPNFMAAAWVMRCQPFALTMPDNRYWSVGEHIADAWSAGRGY